MGETEKIAFKKFYVGKASLFGLYYGAAIGSIIAFFMFLVTTFSGQAKFYFGNLFNVTGISLSFMIGVIAFVGISLGTLVLFITFSLVYNLVSKAGGDVHFDVGEIGTPQATATFQSANNLATAIPAAMAQGAQMGISQVQQGVAQGIQQGVQGLAEVRTGIQQGVAQAVSGEVIPQQVQPIVQGQIQQSVQNQGQNLGSEPPQQVPNRVRVGTANYMDHPIV
jgi:hypothetical protein